MKTLLRIGCVALSISFVLAFWVSAGMAQTEWEKYPGNPVLDLGPNGAWDDYYAYFPDVFFDGIEYKMWYTGNDGSKRRIGYATSPDGIVWTKYPGNPVLDLGPSGTWDDSHIKAPRVLFNGTEYKMWYVGQDVSHKRIGYATSPDGIVWTKYPGNPVLDLGPSGEWDDRNVYEHCILVAGAEYKIWYSGSDGLNQRIGYATSPDGIVWTKYSGNPLVDLGPIGSWEDNHVIAPSILFDGSEYKMWYQGNDGLNWRIGFATSEDGLVWVKSDVNPVIDLGPGSSCEDYGVATPNVLFDGSKYKMWYTALDGSYSRTGYAVSLPSCSDSDADGSWDAACGGWDCEDSDPEIHPGADELCNNGIDDDCDGHIDQEDSDCATVFILEMDASYGSGELSLDFTLGALEPAYWTASLFLTNPFMQLIPLWMTSVPEVHLPVDIQISFPFPSMGWVGISSSIYKGWMLQAFDFAWVYAG